MAGNSGVVRDGPPGHAVRLVTLAKHYTIDGTTDDGDHVYVDGADRLSLGEIRRLRGTARRLVLTVAPSALLQSLLPPTFSASLALIIRVPLDLVAQLSSAYMLDSQDAMFWDLLHNAIARGAIYNYMTGDSALAITIRKPTGGAKGTSRILQAVTSRCDPIEMPAYKPATKADPSFDALTDDQRRRRDAVPIPYVHEGEGVDLGLDEEDDEEI